MAQLAIHAPWRRPASARPEERNPAELARLLPEGVAAILLPHLSAALASYGAREQPAILSAYGVGCVILSDLLSQNKAIPDWREAAAVAMELLASRSEAEIFEDPGAAARALVGADDLIQELQGGAEYRAVCQLLDAAIADMSGRKTTLRGSVTLRAAMARLEALALNARRRTLLAA
jgi:hypothetical protein